jgi:GMP synthase (glutamine-hydrolysing)
MAAYEDELHSWLAPEKLWLSDLVAAEVGVLGICLGSQLLAAALGGTAYPAPKPEAGLIKLQVTESGRGDPTFARFGEWVFSLHQDTFGLPPGSTLLASSDHFPQAFRCGSALAIQFHPDADLDLAKRWGKEEWSLLPAAGVDYDAYCHDLETADAALDENSRAFFEAWLAE